MRYSIVQIRLNRTLLSGKPFRRHSRQNQLDLRSFARFAIQMKLATKTICDDGVDDMQAEAGITLLAAGGEERIECLASDIDTHAAAVV